MIEQSFEISFESSAIKENLIKSSRFITLRKSFVGHVYSSP